MAEIDRPEPKRKPARREFKKPEETSCNCVNWAYCKPSKFQTTHPTCLIPLLPPSPTNVDEWLSLPSSLILLIPSENGIGSLVLVLLLVLELRGYKDRKVCLLKRRLLRIKIEVWRSGVAAWDYDTSIAAMPEIIFCDEDLGSCLHLRLENSVNNVECQAFLSWERMPAPTRDLPGNNVQWPSSSVIIRNANASE